ncbi:MAG TPA: glycosyltransferase [Thermoanaerobaculia bacterium]|nr:glycosyltransferase [Thermoanaerobaculia bacterium]
MKFLYGVGRPAFPFFIGGDGTIAHTLLTELTRAGVDCRFVGTFGDHVVTKLGRLDDLALPYDRSGESLGYSLPYRVTLATEEKFAGLVEKTIETFKPHVVFAQLNQAREILALAKRYGCRTALYVLDVDHEENFLALESEPEFIFAVSDFTRGELRKRFGKESHVLYPLVDFERYRTPRRDEFVTMINPVQVKGVEIALDLAERLPRQEFLFVEGWGTDPAIVRRIERRPNATYMRKQIDMRAVYGRTRVLIVPSQWQEAFGRVVVEAQASGIPVIASRTGGLPEAVGDGGILIDDYRNPVHWLSALQGLLEDRSRYQRLSEKAIENTRRFDLRRELDRLAGILGLSDRDCSSTRSMHLD